VKIFEFLISLRAVRLPRIIFLSSISSVSQIEEKQHFDRKDDESGADYPQMFLKLLGYISMIP
jgi:hypothetical protein